MRDGVLYRQVNKVHQQHYDRLIDSGLYERLVEEGLLIAHEEIRNSHLTSDAAYRVIRPERISFVSYPYEWSFSQLKDAALATLAVERLAIERGMSLRDASAYNIQFHEGRPILIDTLSFERLTEGRPWDAYGQFCRHFLAPLALMSYRDLRLGRHSASHIDGIPIDLATPLLPMRARFRPSLLIHLFMHARSQRKNRASETAERRRSFDLRALKGLIDSLTNAVEGLQLSRSRGSWLYYYEDATHYGEEGMERKKGIVREFISEVSPNTVWDLGANTGMFSTIASDLGAQTVAFEIDPECVEEHYRRVKGEGRTNLLPLVCDLTNPSAAIGWAHEERMTLTDRGPADLVMALALVHHLAIGNNVPLPRIAEYFSKLGSHLIVEFVPKEDEKVRRLLASREDIFPGYTRRSFEDAFSDCFAIQRVQGIEHTDRVLYLMHAR